MTYPGSNSIAFILRGKTLDIFVPVWGWEFLLSAVSNLEGLPVEAPAELLVTRPGDQAETDGYNSQPAIIQESAWCLTGLQVDVVDAEISREGHVVFRSLLCIYFWMCLKMFENYLK